MPSHRSRELIETGASPAEKPLDFAELQAEKGRLFKEIEENTLKLSTREKFLVVSRIFEHSIKDGFEIARRLGVPTLSITESLGQEDFIQKHADFAKKFSDFVGRNVGYLSNTPRRKDDPDSSNVNLASSLQFFLSRRAVGLAVEQEEREKTFDLDKIDSHYAHFIRNRRLKSPEVPADTRSQVEVTAEDHLLSAEAVLEESYYTGPIRKFLGVETEEELERERFSGVKRYAYEEGVDRVKWSLRSNLISKGDFDAIIMMESIELNDEDRSELRRARYAPSRELFDQRKREAIKGLLEGRKQEGIFEGKPYTKSISGIEQSLIARGFREDEFEIRFDEEKGEYVVIKIEKEAGKDGVPFEAFSASEASAKKGSKAESGKEKFKEVEVVPDEMKYRGQDYEIRELKILNGEVNKLYRGLYGGKGSVLLDNSGNTIDSYTGASSLRQVGNHKVIEVRSGEDLPQLVVDGIPLKCEEHTVILGSHDDNCVELGGNIYWLGYEARGHLMLVKDDRIYREFLRDQRLPDGLHVISGKLVYIIVDSGSVVAGLDKFVNFGNERFGPYEDIKLCENSTDKLIFYAKKGDEHFVYVDGEEKKLSNPHFYKCSGILSTGDEVFLLLEHTDGNWWAMFDKEDTFRGQNNNPYSNFLEINGHMFYLTKTRGGQIMLSWGGNKFPIILDDYQKSKAVGFQDQVFITDSKRILSLKYGETKFNELTFDGTVEVVNSGGKLFIIESLPDKKRVWQYSEAGEFKLNEQEQRDLDLANAVAKEDLSTTQVYFEKYYPLRTKEEWRKTVKAGIKKMLAQSGRFVGAVNQTIKEAPELFLDTLRAKDDKPTEYLMTQMFYYMFPEAQANRERAIEGERGKKRSSANIFGGGSSTGSGQEGGRGGYVDYDPGMDHLASVDEAGYYEMVRANREVLKLREPLPPSTFITQGLFGNYTGKGWAKVNVPISQEVTDPAKEATFEFVDENASQKVNLPRVANGRIVTERLKGIDSKGQEMPISIIEKNNLGEVRVDKGTEAKHIAYSTSYSEAPKTMAEISERDYDRFRTDFERSFGDVMTKEIGDVGDEIDIFIASLADKTPREKVIAIQEFCYEYGYYNLDDQPRDTDSFDERLAIMEGRMDELRATDSNLASKKYAGICTDFATLTTAMLRKAGFVSGIASGYVSEADSTVVKTDRAHATSYVLWPNPQNKDGKPDLIIVDGTPSSITPKIVEQEHKAAEIMVALTVDAEKELAGLERVLKTMDVHTIRQLENGKLENTLNHILYGVKQSHVDVMSRVLNASRYAGFDILEMTRGNIEDEVEFRKFLEEEIYKEKTITHDVRERRGEDLFNLMIEFTGRFEKDRNVHGKDEALDVLEKVFDVSGRVLDPIESRSAAAVITYLRAKHMK